MKKRVGAALAAAVAVVALTLPALALPAQARPIVDPPRPQWLVRAQEWERAHPAYRQRSGPQGHLERKRQQKAAPTAEHVPLTPHWSTSQAYA